MSIPFTGTGGLFTRLGLIGALIYRENLQQAILHTRFDNLPAQYVEPDNDLLAPIMPNAQSYAVIPPAMVGTLTALATQTVQRMVYNDQPAQSGTLALALAEVIRQLQISPTTVSQCTVTATPAVQGTPNGDGVLVATALTGTGLPLENMVVEAIPFTCSRDAQSGGAQIGNEQFNFNGQPVGNDPTWYLWPQGSAASGNLNAISPLSNQSGGNLLNNGGFDAFTANVPNQWTLTVGTAGTDLLASAGTVYSGSHSLELVGNAGGTGVLVAMYQQFGSTSGTTQTLQPNTAYAYTIRIRTNIVPAAGVLSIGLVGGATTGSMSVLDDAQSVASVINIDLTALAGTGTWYEYHGVLRTPPVMPAVYALQVAITTAISTSTNIFLDHMGAALLTPVYAGGPGVAMFSGATQFIKGDRWILTDANDRASSTDGATFQTLFDRLFGMRGLGLLLPSTTGSPTIADSLITT